MTPRVTVRASGAGYVVEVTEHRKGAGVTSTAYRTANKVKATGVGEFLAGFGHAELSVFGRLTPKTEAAA